MVADDGSPILMDLGSAVRARIEIRSRQEALLQQDLASEHSSMPYRAPELFDVKTNTTLDEKVDIWVRILSRSERCPARRALTIPAHPNLRRRSAARSLRSPTRIRPSRTRPTRAARST